MSAIASTTSSRNALGDNNSNNNNNHNSFTIFINHSLGLNFHNLNSILNLLCSPIVVDREVIVDNVKWLSNCHIGKVKLLGAIPSITPFYDSFKVQGVRVVSLGGYQVILITKYCCIRKYYYNIFSFLYCTRSNPMNWGSWLLSLRHRNYTCIYALVYRI